MQYRSLVSRQQAFKQRNVKSKKSSAKCKWSDVTSVSQCQTPHPLPLEFTSFFLIMATIKLLFVPFTIYLFSRNEGDFFIES